MNTMKDSQILSALEQLGAQLRWETPSIWISREPAGKVNFTAYISSDFTRGTESAFGHGNTLAEACAELIRRAGPRDPDAMRDRKIQELKEQIRKLEQVQIGPAPFKPGLLLAPGALEATIEINASTVKDNVPF